MVQILPARPNIGNSIGQGIHRGLSTYLENEKQQGKNQELQQALASLSQQPNQNLTPEQKYLQFKQAMVGKEGSDKWGNEYLESLKQTQAARPEQQAPNPGINALSQIESLIGKPGIGLAGSANLGGEARFNRGKFKSVQAALLPLFKSMFPRGMTEKEFKFIQENYIPQANDTEDTIKGKIDGLRQLIGDQQGQQPQQQMESKQGQSVPMRDSQGNEYDIPAHLVQQAQQKGLIPQ